MSKLRGTTGEQGGKFKICGRIINGLETTRDIIYILEFFFPSKYLIFLGSMVKVVLIFNNTRQKKYFAKRSGDSSEKNRGKNNMS